MLGMKRTPDHFKRDMIRRCPDDYIKCICECCHNVLKGNVSMTAPHKGTLARQSRNIRKLADPKVSMKSKRKLLTPELVDLLTETVKPEIERV